MKLKSTRPASFSIFRGGRVGFHRGVDYIDNDVHTAGVPSAGIGAYKPVPWSHLHSHNDISAFLWL